MEAFAIFFTVLSLVVVGSVAVIAVWLAGSWLTGLAVIVAALAVFRIFGFDHNGTGHRDRRSLNAFQRPLSDD